VSRPCVWSGGLRSGHPPLPGCGGSAWAGVAGLEVAQDELAYLPAERLPGLVVQKGVLASEDAAKPGFVRGRLQADEAAGDAKGPCDLTHPCPFCYTRRIGEPAA